MEYLSESDRFHLHVRLKNCLQTILDLEPELGKLELGHMLMKEFGVLKSFIEKLEKVQLIEEDVERIENATANFLDELRAPLSLLETDNQSKRQTQ